MELPPPIKPQLQMYPHKLDVKTVHDTRYDPLTYISVQTKVNLDEKYEKLYFENLMIQGWVKIPKIETIFGLPKGTQFKYRLNQDSLSKVPDGTFRSGGWLIGRNENEDDLDLKNKYILYKGFNGAIFSLQLKDIKEIYIKSKKKEVPAFKKPAKVTNFPVFLINPNTNEPEIVYYAKDNAHKIRFENSDKYQKAIQLGRWVWSDVFNN